MAIITKRTQISKHWKPSARLNSAKTLMTVVTLLVHSIICIAGAVWCCVLGPSGYFFFVGILASCSYSSIFIPLGEISLGDGVSTSGSSTARVSPKQHLCHPRKTCPGMRVLQGCTRRPSCLKVSGNLRAEGKDLNSAWITDLGCQNSREFS